MGQNPGDKKSQPSLELPSLPGLGRRKKRARRGASEEEEPASTPVTTPERADVEGTTDLTAANDHSSLEDHDTRPLTPGEPPAQPQLQRQPQRRADRRSERSAPRRAERTGGRGRLLPGPLAAALTGLLIGVAGGAGTYGALAGCEAVRDVSSCGGGPGFFLLVAILAVLVLLGAGALKLFGVPAPGSTSFLAVGIIAVVVMLVLLDVVYSPWMFVVVPTLGVASYLVAHWVTTRFDAATPHRPDWT